MSPSAVSRHGCDRADPQSWCLAEAVLSFSRSTASLSLLDWKSIGNEVCDSSGGRRIQVRQHSNHITWPKADLQFAIHPGCATAMAEAAGPVNRRLLKSISILATVRGLDFPRREHLGVLRLE